MTHPAKTISGALAILAVLVSPALAEGSSSISAVISGKTLNLAYIDTYSSLDISLRMTGRKNRLTARQRSAGSTSLSAVMAGQSNRADIGMAAAGTAGLFLVQTSKLEGAATAKDGLIVGQAPSGDYVTIYESGKFGYAEITGYAQRTGWLSRGH